MTIPTARLEEIRELAAKATPGPWAVNPSIARIDAFDEFGPVPICELLWPTILRSEGQTKLNAHHIANCDPQTISSIVSELIERRNKDAEHAK